jgi:DNA polymerase III delta prime subunit
MENNQLLSELLRPKSLTELNLPPDVFNSLQRMETSGSVMNLLFYGEPGIGKTSAARILTLNTHAYEINGSFNNGDKTMLKAIENFASSVSMFSRHKVCFIDEAEYLTKEVQAGLRYTIEKFSASTRFILTANEFKKITPALRSRCVAICFDVAPKDRAVVVDRMVARYEKRLTELGYEYDPTLLREIVGIYFPDLRNIANQLQLNFS